jgi:hypothetical protein
MSQPKQNVKVQLFKEAMAELQQAIEQVAEKMVADRIGWYGKAAVASALAQHLAGNLLDNYHDGPDFFHEVVEGILSNPATPAK